MAENIPLERNGVQVLLEKRFDPFYMAIREDGIVLIEVPGNLEIGVSHVKLIVENLEELGKGKKYPLLILVGEYTLPTPETRAYIASVESDPFASAEAYVIRSFSQKLVGSIFLSFNKPVRPTRLFNDEAKAVEWLRTFL